MTIFSTIWFKHSKKHYNKSTYNYTDRQKTHVFRLYALHLYCFYRHWPPSTANGIRHTLPILRPTHTVPCMPSLRCFYGTIRRPVPSVCNPSNNMKRMWCDSSADMHITLLKHPLVKEYRHGCSTIPLVRCVDKHCEKKSRGERIKT